MRRILPKGTSFEDLNQFEVAYIASHINSVPRASLGGASPLQLAHTRIKEELLEELGLGLIDPDEICLKPSLLTDLRRDMGRSNH